MKLFLPTVLSLSLLPAALSAQRTPPQPTALPATASAFTTASSTVKPISPGLAANYGKLPLSFEANQGQSDPEVRFLSHGQGYSLFLTDRAAVLALSKGEPADDAKNKSLKSMTKPAKQQTDVIRI